MCQVKLTSIEAAKLRLHIKYGYHHNWIIDNLPSANLAVNQGREQKHYAGGFPIGIMSSDKTKAYIYNHVNINVEYHAREEGYRVVGFAVEPLSVKHQFAGNYEWDGISIDGVQKQLETCPSSTTGEHMSRERIEALQIVNPGETVLFTYDVIWKESDVAWSSHWDVYLTEDHLVPAQVHWYSITNSILVVVFLSLLVISILVRNLKRDPPL